MQGGLTSAYPRKRNGNSPREADLQESRTSGAKNFGQTVSGWQTLFRDISPKRIPVLTGLLVWRRWPSMRRINMASTIWREMSGSGLPTGIDPITTINWQRRAEWRATQKARTRPSTLPNPMIRKRPIAVDRFYVLISTVRATW